LAPDCAENLLTSYRARERSPSEVVDSLLAAIFEADSSLGALTVVCADRARRQASEATRRLLRGDARPLEGVPFVAKDLLDTAGVVTAYGSRLFHGRVPTRDAAAVARLANAGAILLGKTATHEFGWGITTTSDHAAPTRNPWAPQRVAGGSSGGSAAALAAGFAPLALGTDTAGSIRIPADFCGVVGFRPTAHTVPRDGAFPLAPSLDQVGPMARTPGDVALVYDVLAGRSPTPVMRENLRGIRVGVATAPEAVPIEARRAAALSDLADVAAGLGAHVGPTALDDRSEALAVLGTILRAEGLFVHRRTGLWPGRAAEYGRDVSTHLRRAEALSREDYVDGYARRADHARSLVAAFERVDVLMTPVSGVGPAAIDGDPLDGEMRRRTMTFTAPQSLGGLPACAMRAGFDDDGLPIGVQLTGPAGSDRFVLAVAGALFSATPDVQRVVPALVRAGSGAAPAQLG
jgi:aspartyl-tRNA(Asn)/glutamyl-tRNA(Gln) amidotransferase subunit A